MNHPDNPLNDWPIRDTDLSRSFEKLKEFMRPHYHRGQRYERAVAGFSFRGKTYKTLNEIESEIDRFLDEGDRSF